MQKKLKKNMPAGSYVKYRQILIAPQSKRIKFKKNENKDTSNS